MAGAAQKHHTILLFQVSKDRSTRSWQEFESVGEAMDGVLRLFEKVLREKAPPSTAEVTYDITQVYEYVDTLHDMAAMVLGPSTMTYEPHDKAWIKHTLLAHLKRQASS